MKTAPTALFEPGFLRQLERLRLMLARRVAMGRKGAHTARLTGSSLEFADYRNYVPGDDVRNVDWNVYGRTGRLYLKQFEEEQDLDVSILVDVSASMRWSPEGTSASSEKLALAGRLAAAVAYLALFRLDRAAVFFFADRLLPDSGFKRSRPAIHTLLEFLSSMPAAEGQKTDLERVLREFSHRVKRRGLVVILSDFLIPGGADAALQRLKTARFDAVLLQILHPLELDPGDSGDWLLRDSETGTEQRVAFQTGLRRRYRETVEEFNNSLRQSARARGFGFARLTTDQEFESAALEALRETPFIK